MRPLPALCVQFHDPIEEALGVGLERIEKAIIVAENVLSDCLPRLPLARLLHEFFHERMISHCSPVYHLSPCRWCTSLRTACTRIHGARTSRRSAQ